MSSYARLAFTDSVRQVQAEYGSEQANSRRLDAADGSDRLGEFEAAFLERRDGFYLATVGETGWPYLQFRGGPAGFLQVLDERTLGYAVVRGNRQYITLGNLRAENRVALFFMDYARRQRLKVFGRATVLAVDADPALTDRVSRVRSAGQVEAVMRISIEGLSWNCSSSITPRFTLAELADLLEPLQAELDRLQAENEQLRARLAASS